MSSLPSVIFFFFSYRRSRKFLHMQSLQECVGRVESPVSGYVYESVNSVQQTLMHINTHKHSLSHIVCYFLIVFIHPASHSCLIGNTSPDGSLSTQRDQVCTSVKFVFCLCRCVHACVSCISPASATANSCERPADRCSRRGFACLFLCLNIYFSCFVYFGGLGIFFSSLLGRG